ncbi:hypothetical protein OSTOST_06921 [Ostertagia ostertagi]
MRHSADPKYSNHFAVPYPSRNRYGRPYISGRPLLTCDRQKIVQLVRERDEEDSHRESSSVLLTAVWRHGPGTARESNPWPRDRSAMFQASSFGNILMLESFARTISPRNPVPGESSAQSQPIMNATRKVSKIQNYSNYFAVPYPSRNRYGRPYISGRPLLTCDRQKIVQLFENGMKKIHIAKQLDWVDGHGAAKFAHYPKVNFEFGSRILRNDSGSVIYFSKTKEEPCERARCRSTAELEICSIFIEEID